MGVPKNISAGQLDTKISPVANDKVDGVITTRPTFDKVLSDQRYTMKSYFNREAINADRYADLLHSLRAYVEGSDISVIYFHRLHTNVDNNASEMDVSSNLDPIHNGCLQINNFEIKLKDQLSFTYDTDQTISTIAGSALVYPGFNPNMGDLFTYRVDEVVADGRVGLFKITNAPNRLSVKMSSFHEINFELIKFATVEELDYIYNSVREVAWFNKKRFLTEDAALLKSDEEFVITDANFLIANLTAYYKDTFYGKILLETYTRPDGIYDPYLISFLQSILRTDFCRDIPLQLLDTFGFKHRSIWQKFINPNATNWKTIVLEYISLTHTVRFMDTNINTLINKDKIELYISADNSDELKDDLVPKPYCDFYIGPDADKAVTEFEQLIYMYLNKGTVMPDILFKVCKEYVNMTLVEQFYRIPMLLFILQNVVQSITTGRNNIKITISSSITDFKSKLYLPVIIKDTEFTLELNKSHEVDTDKKLATILPLNGKIGKYIKILNPTHYDVEIYSNKESCMQKIVSYNKTSILSGYSRTLLGILRAGNSNVFLQYVDPKTGAWYVEHSNGFDIIEADQLI